MIRETNTSFRNFSVEQNVYDLSNGLIPEMAQAFGHELTDEPDVENLGQLIGAVAPQKELQQNIELVQERLGTDTDALSLVQDWSKRSGLLMPTLRTLETITPISPVVADGETEVRYGTSNVDVAIVTGGIRNWMARRAMRLAQFSGNFSIDTAVLIGGSREMKQTEGPEVEEGMTEGDYLEKVISPQLGNLGIKNECIHVDSKVGDEVMREGAKTMLDIVESPNSIAVISNAGAWIQNAGQMRRGLIDALGASSDGDDEVAPFGNLLVSSDGVRLGTGVEPTVTHQNPYTFIGNIPRSAQEIVRQQQL